MNHLTKFLSKNRHAFMAYGLGLLLFITVNWLGDYLQNNEFSSVFVGISKSFLLSMVFGLLAWFSIKHISNRKKFLGIGTLKNSILFFFFGMGLLLGPLLTTLTISSVFGWASYQFNPDILIIKQQLLTLLVVFLFEAFPEEILFRGFLFGRFKEDYTVKKAAIFTTILFVIFPIIAVPIQSLILSGDNLVGGNDGITLGYLVYMLIFGSLTVFLRILTGSLWTSMGFHLVFVFMNHLIGIRSDSLILIVDYSNELSIQIILFACILLVLAGIIWYGRKKEKRLKAKKSLISTQLTS